MESGRSMADHVCVGICYGDSRLFGPSTPFFTHKYNPKQQEMYHASKEDEVRSPYTHHTRSQHPSPGRAQKHDEQQHQHQSLPPIAGRSSTPLAPPTRTNARRAWMVHNSDNVKAAIHNQHLPVRGDGAAFAGERRQGGGPGEDGDGPGAMAAGGSRMYPYHHYNHQPFIPIQSPLPPPMQPQAPPGEEGVCGGGVYGAVPTVCRISMWQGRLISE